MVKQKPRELARVSRDRQIWEQIQQGWSRQRIAQFHGISQGRVAQIVKQMCGVFTPDENRDWLRAKHEAYLDELEKLIHGKGRLMTASGNGRVITDDQGNPVYDEFAKVEAVNAALRIMKGLRELDDLDHRRPREDRQGVDTETFEEYMNYIQRLADEKRVLQSKLAGYESGSIVNAEVVEDPAGSSR